MLPLHSISCPLYCNLQICRTVCSRVEHIWPFSHFGQIPLLQHLAVGGCRLGQAGLVVNPGLGRPGSKCVEAGAGRARNNLHNSEILRNPHTEDLRSVTRAANEKFSIFGPGPYWGLLHLLVETAYYSIHTWDTLLHGWLVIVSRCDIGMLVCKVKQQGPRQFGLISRG